MSSGKYIGKSNTVLFQLHAMLRFVSGTSAHRVNFRPLSLWLLLCSKCDRRSGWAARNHTKTIVISCIVPIIHTAIQQIHVIDDVRAQTALSVYTRLRWIHLDRRWQQNAVGTLVGEGMRLRENVHTSIALLSSTRNCHMQKQLW